MCQEHATHEAGPVTCLRLLSFPFVAIFGHLAWMLWGDPLSLWSIPIVLVVSYAWFCVGGLSHELSHGNLPLSERTSNAFGYMIGFLLVIPRSVYKEIHMRHHAYLNTPLDWELWPYSDPQASLRFRRIFVWFDILLGVGSTAAIWSRICFSRDSPADEKSKRLMRIEYAVAGLGRLFIGITVWQLIRAGVIVPKIEHLIFVIPVFLSGTLNAIRKMIEHLGTASFDPLYGTRTIVADNWVTRTLSFFNFDLAVHGPHHRHPKLKHNQLEPRMDELQEQNPTAEYPVFPSFRSALMDTIRSIVFNPGVGQNAGCEDDLSHLPGGAAAISS